MDEQGVETQPPGEAKWETRRDPRTGKLLYKTGTGGKRAATLGPEPSEYDKRTQEQARKYEQEKTAGDLEIRWGNVKEGKYPPRRPVMEREGIDSPAGSQSPMSSPISERSERGKAA